MVWVAFNWLAHGNLHESGELGLKLLLDHRCLTLAVMRVRDDVDFRVVWRFHHHGSRPWRGETHRTVDKSTRRQVALSAILVQSCSTLSPLFPLLACPVATCASSLLIHAD